VSGIKLVHELLGHKDITTTIRYAHLSPNMGQERWRCLMLLRRMGKPRGSRT
jgi:site-specific recombinase XerD